MRPHRTISVKRLKGNQVTMIGLRNIDLGEALKNRYVISLLAIDVQAE